MALITYPLNKIEYSAEDAELFHATRASGIYANNSFDYSVTGADNTIVIGTGIGWIKNSEFAGKVIALKDKVSLYMGLPDSVYPRIDAIVIQFDANMNATNIIVKNGTASSEPVPPEVSRDEAVYELHLYHVKREAGSLSITPSNITDLRLNSSYCGLMADSVTNIDTSAIEKQVADLIESLQNEISNVIDGSAYLLRDGSANMTGNLPMDGHKVTGLGTPTADGDAVPLGYANQNFAPAGYGLGEAVTCDWADVDDIYSPGWYKFQGSVSIGGVSLNSPFMRVDSWDVNNCAQTLFPLGSEAACLARRKTGGVWGVWEWINPPMLPNVEYRTTEKHNGKAVYTKLVQFGSLPNNTEKIVTPMPAGANMIEAIGYAVGDSYNIPIPGYYSIQSMGNTRNSGRLWIATTTDMSSYIAWITVKYTKE